MSGYAFILGPNSARHDMADMRRFAEHDPHVAAAFERFASTSGFDVDVLLHRAPLPADQPVMRINALGIAAGMLGLVASLRTRGIEPSVVGGISLGEWVAACVAGVLSEDELIGKLILAMEYGSAEPGRPEANAFSLVLPGRPAPELTDGVHLAVDFGVVRGGARLLMLGGVRTDLERFPGALDLPDVAYGRTAHHTPLRARAAAAIDRGLDSATLAEPHTPVCSGLGGGTVATTAAQVREVLVRNEAESLDIEGMVAAVAGHRPTVGIGIGPFLAKAGLSIPFPMAFLDEPGDVDALAGDVVLSGAGTST